MRHEEGAPCRQAEGPHSASQHHVKSSTTSTRAHGLAASTPGHERRWDRRRHIDGTEVVAWCAFTLICTALILAACALTWLVAS